MIEGERDWQKKKWVCWLHCGRGYATGCPGRHFGLCLWLYAQKWMDDDGHLRHLNLHCRCFECCCWFWWASGVQAERGDEAGAVRDDERGGCVDEKERGNMGNKRARLESNRRP